MDIDISKLSPIQIEEITKLFGMLLAKISQIDEDTAISAVKEQMESGKGVFQIYKEISKIDDFDPKDLPETIKDIVINGV